MNKYGNEPHAKKKLGLWSGFGFSVRFTVRVRITVRLRFTVSVTQCGWVGVNFSRKKSL